MEEDEQRQINTLIFFRSCKFSVLAVALAATGPRRPAHATDGNPHCSPTASGYSEPSSSTSPLLCPGLRFPCSADTSYHSFVSNSLIFIISQIKLAADDDHAECLGEEFGAMCSARGQPTMNWE